MVKFEMLLIWQACFFTQYCNYFQERLQKTELCLKEEQETRVIEKQTAEKQHLQKEEEHIQKIKIFEEKTKDLVNTDVNKDC